MIVFQLGVLSTFMRCRRITTIDSVMCYNHRQSDNKHQNNCHVSLVLGSRVKHAARRLSVPDEFGRRTHSLQGVTQLDVIGRS